MTKKLLLTIINLIGSLLLFAQENNVVQRIILIGDAGEINHEQETVIPDAVAKVLTGKTSVFYLGDNIYPRGMGLPGTKEEATAQQIMRSQYTLFRNAGVPVYFIPGNHDWDRMGKNGLAKIKAQSNFIQAQKDSLLQVIPANGCPDPIAIPLGDETVVIAYDSEWWLFPYNKESADSECDCNTEDEVIEKLSELFWQYHNKMIILAAHHPFRSYGAHGGKYNWKDHLFPLTAVRKNLFIPLPGIGSLYPLLRKSIFINPEDIPHPKYQNLIQKVETVFEGFPNIIYAAGHEHGLQLIEDKNTYIVSGAGAKSTYAKKAKTSLFADTRQGFAIVDILEDKSSNITFYNYVKEGIIQEAFSYHKPYTNLNELVEKNYGSLIVEDSLVLAANNKYDQKGKLHRKIFGENYRKEWAAPTQLPVLRLSQLHGGLTPLQRGGGMQTISLRLADKSGKQWVLRSVNKVPEAVLPGGLKQSFAKDIVDDYMSGQHPYSALIVPPIANAANVPHTNPVIGIVAPDSNLASYNKLMAGSMALLEEREPLGKSDNSIKAMKALIKDNDNTFKAKTFFRAMLLDLLIGDWDRHEDQWRWKNTGSNGDKDYLGVPRDRDQVLKMNDGFAPWLASRNWIMPTFQGFDSIIPAVRHSLYKHRFVNSFPAFQFSHKEWTTMTADFVAAITDAVIDSAINQLPASAKEIRGAELAEKMKKRRNSIPAAMESFYAFTQEIVDIQLSNKHEQVTITDHAEKGLTVSVRKINKEGEVKRKLMEKTFDPSLTKEIRLYLHKGDDTVFLNYSSPVKLRIIGGKGNKHIDVIESPQVKYYSNTTGTSYAGNSKQIIKHLKNDSLHTAFVPVNLYNKTIPLITAGFNRDDKLIIGAGFRHIHQKGFRKLPYTRSHQVLFSGAFATGAYRVAVKSDWIAVIGKADIDLQAYAWVPNNTHNFFGTGNNSVYDKSHSISYYRSRYTLAEVSPLLRWRSVKNTIIKAGPSFQYYHMSAEKNKNRFILSGNGIHTHDSVTVTTDKMFAGAVFSYEKDGRNNALFPSSGGYFSFDTRAYQGLNSSSKSFMQFRSAMSVYFALNKAETIVLANRTGGGYTAGNAAFYQSLFLGGHQNLGGFRQYRFAGSHLLYNNLELRMHLLQTGSYILPGQLGITAFYDTGKVWTKEGKSGKIHQGVGAGLYFAPADLTVFQLLAGYSTEGWYPQFTMGFRF